MEIPALRCPDSKLAFPSDEVCDLALARLAARLGINDDALCEHHLMPRSSAGDYRALVMNAQDDMFDPFRVFEISDDLPDNSHMHSVTARTDAKCILADCEPGSYIVLEQPYIDSLEAGTPPALTRVYVRGPSDVVKAEYPVRFGDLVEHRTNDVRAKLHHAMLKLNDKPNFQTLLPLVTCLTRFVTDEACVLDTHRAYWLWCQMANDNGLVDIVANRIIVPYFDDVVCADGRTVPQLSFAGLVEMCDNPDKIRLIAAREASISNWARAEFSAPGAWQGNSMEQLSLDDLAKLVATSCDAASIAPSWLVPDSPDQVLNAYAHYDIDSDEETD